jgi:hypothetical protein
MVAPNWRETVEQFQRTFAPYFPHLAADLDAAGFEMTWIETRVLMNPKATVRRPQARRELAKIRSALNLMGAHEIGYWQPFISELYWAEQEGDDIARQAKELFQFLLALSEMKEEGTLQKVLDRFVGTAERAIEMVPDTRNINWEAVHAVDMLRLLWWRNVGQNAPSRALNPASIFASYLQDGFHFLDVDADPLSAFKRWVETRSDEDFDPSPVENPPGRRS